MVFDITQLKKIRKQLNLTQHKFAKEAKISQSMVAKIESGRLDPTFSYVKRIEDTISNLTNNQEKSAKDIMTKKIYSVSLSDKISKVVKMIKDYNISQVLVIEKEIPIGLVTESSLIEKSAKIVKEVIKPSPPIIDEGTREPAIISLLRFYPIIIVQRKGKVKGVITKHDVIINMNK